MSAGLNGMNIYTDKFLNDNIDRKKIFSAIKLIAIDLLVLIMAYGGYYRSVFGNSDTLWGVLDPSSTFVARLGSNRWFAAIFEWIFITTGFIPAKHFRLSLLLFICSLVISLFVIQMIFLELFSRICTDAISCKTEHIAIVAAVTLSYVNVLFTEFFYFTESYHIFSFAFLFMAAGLYEFSKKHTIRSLLLFCCMAMCYQMSCPIASICIGTYIYLEHRCEFSLDLIKEELIKSLPPMLIFVIDYSIGPVIHRIITKAGLEVSSVKSVSTGYSVEEQISNVISSVKGLVSSNLGLTPGIYVSLIVFCVVVAVVTIICIKKRKWNQLGTFFLVQIILLALTFVVQIAENPANFVARTVITFYFAQSMQLLMLFFFVSENFDSNNSMRLLKKLLYKLPVLYVLFNMFFIQCIIQNRIISETLDRLYAERIFEKIEAYEQETGIIVDKIATVNDIDSSPFYDQVHFSCGAINHRCYSDYTWTFLQYCAYETDIAGNLSGRSFEHVDMEDAIYEEFFEGQNWIDFDEDEQIVIREDTAYICVF